MLSFHDNCRPSHLPLHILNQLFPVCEKEIKKSFWPFHNMYQKISPTHSKNLLDSLCIAVSLPADVMITEVPHENHFLPFGNFHQLSKESLVPLFLLIWWPITDGLLLSSDLYPEAFNKPISPLTVSY